MNIKLGFIGAGNMAGAIIEGVLSSGFFKPEEVGVFDISRDKLEAYEKKRLCIFDGVGGLVKASGVVVLAVKPQNFTDILPEIKPEVTKDKLFISIAAGVDAKRLKDGTGFDLRLVLAMPNTPLLLGEGATALCAVPPATDKDLKLAAGIFSSAGIAVEISPDKMKEIIPVNGSSPAFFYYFAKILAEAAEKTGIPAQTAYPLIAKTMIGSARMLTESGKTPDELIDMVCSPGGTTLAGMKALGEKGFKESVEAAAEACVKRAYELAEMTVDK